MSEEPEREFEELEYDEDREIDTRQTSPLTKVQVYIQSTIGPGKTEQMQVALDAAVSELKFTVSKMFNLDDDVFHVVHAGRTLDPDDILGNYDIEQGDTLLLIPKSTAGAN